MKKRLIALMVAGIMTTATLTGCSDNSNKTVDEDFMGTPEIKDGYVIIKQNDKDVLHKGDYYRDYDGSSHGFKFDCGENYFSNVEHSAYYEKPQSERYDEKCEECFSNEQ